MSAQLDTVAKATAPNGPSSAAGPVESAPARPEPRAPAPESHAAQAAGIDRPVRARLAYDREEARTVVELLDPQTGNVLFRFPPENLAEHLVGLKPKAPGTVLDQLV